MMKSIFLLAVIVSGCILWSSEWNDLPGFKQKFPTVSDIQVWLDESKGKLLAWRIGTENTEVIASLESDILALNKSLSLLKKENSDLRQRFEIKVDEVQAKPAQGGVVPVRDGEVLSDKVGSNTLSIADRRRKLSVLAERMEMKALGL